MYTCIDMAIQQLPDMVESSKKVCKSRLSMQPSIMLQFNKIYSD